jgi:cation:H+ antiporter
VNFPPALLALLGFILLTLGGDLLVRGSARLARAFGIPSLVVGLTVVAVGTSAPEGAVSIQAGLAGNAGVALGNVLGSNAMNILLILGLSAVVAPLAVQRQLVRFDIPVMIGASVLVLLLSLDRNIGFADGVVLLVLCVVYLVVTVEVGKRSEEDRKPRRKQPKPGLPRGFKYRILDLMLVLLGLAALIAGADALVDGSVQIARVLGASELVIGITLVAAGTSAPELATTIIAGLKGEQDLAVGNVIGSNIMNLFFVLGATGAVSPTGIPVPQGAITFGMPVMVGVAIACLPIFFTGRRIARWEGSLLLLYYGLYVFLVLLDAGGLDDQHLVRRAVFLYLVPLTVLMALLVWWQQWQERKATED